MEAVCRLDNLLVRTVIYSQKVHGPPVSRCLQSRAISTDITIYPNKETNEFEYYKIQFVTQHITIFSDLVFRFFFVKVSTVNLEIIAFANPYFDNLSPIR